MNPLLAATLRRHGPLLGAVVILALFTLVHVAVFAPAAARYQRALSEARALGYAFDPSRAEAVVPPRVFALVGDNTLPSGLADDQGGSGVLAANVLEEVTRLAERRGLAVMKTEPGALTNDRRSMVVRAHLQMRGSYAQFVGLLDDLGRQRRLYAVESFTMAPSEGTRSIDLWVSRLVLKRGGAAR